MDAVRTAEGNFLIGGKNVNDMRVVDLKEELEKRGLSKSGSKSVLLARLVEHLELEKLSNGGGKAAAPAVQSSHAEDDIISQYKLQQQQALEEARKAADQARAGHVGTESTPIGSPEARGTAPKFPPATPATEGRKRRRHNKDSSNEDDSVKSPKAPTSLQEASVSGSGGDKQAELVATAEPQEQPSSTVALQPAAVADISEKSGEKIVSQLDSTAASSVATPSAGESGEGERTCGHGVQLQADNTTTSTDHPTSAVSVDEKEENAGEQLSTGPADSGKTESNAEKVAEEELTVEEDKEELNFDEHIDESQSRYDAVKEENMDTSTTDSNPTDKDDKPARKRKWGTTKPSQRAALSISTDSLKGLIGSVSTALANGATEAKEEEEETDGPVVVKERTPPKRIIVAKDDAESKREITIRDEKSLDEIVEARTIRHQRVTEEGLTRERSPSPPRKPVSCVLHVTGLTRPFTAKQLHELLSKFGQYDQETQFWIDTRKSNCIVKYETEEEATKAREALHGVKWPQSNPRVLRVDFTSQMELDKELGIKIQPVEVKVDVGKSNETDVDQEKTEVRKRSRSREEDRRRKDAKRTSRSPDPRRRRSRSPSKQDDKKIWPTNREWDRGKDLDKSSGKTEEKSRNRRSVSPDRKAAGKTEPPARLLDDLFRKTTTIPCIYWLPLTDAQIASREKERKAREAARREKIRQEEEARDRQRNSRSSPDRHNRRR